MQFEAEWHAVPPGLLCCFAGIYMTEEYLILKGGHYQIINGYTRYTKEAKTLLRKDILNAEYINMRSKNLLRAFIVLCALLFPSEMILRVLFSAMKLIDKQWNIIEMLCEVLLNNEHGMNLLVFIALIYVSLVFSAGLVLVIYICVPQRFLLISALGQSVAIEQRYYGKADLDNIIQI